MFRLHMARRPGRPPAGPRSRNASPVSDAAAAPQERVFPTVAETLRPAGPFLVPLLTAIAARIALAAVLPLAAEDAYITFRYARSVATGHGFQYNPGETVMGFTSAPWTLWCAAGLAAGASPEPWARGTLLLADLLTLLAGGRMLLAAAGRGAAWTFTAFFAAWPFFPAVTASGMETGAMLSLIVLGAALARAGSRATGPALGLLALWRPEGVVAALVLALGARWRDRLIALALAGPAFALLAWVFGSPLPHSALAKARLYGTPGPWEGRHWWEWLLPAPAFGWPQTGETNQLLGLLVVIPAAAAAGLPVLWRARRSAAALAAAAALAVWAGYAVTGAAWFFWYFAVPLGGVALLAAAGLPRLARGPWLPAAAALYLLGIWPVAVPLYVGRAQNEFHLFGGAARVLAAAARPGESVLLEPIGIIGWRVPLAVIDESGLVTPRVLERRLRGAGWYADLVAAERPEWLVIRRGVVESGEAFAGAGRPFRDAAERDRVMGAYPLVEEVDPRSGPHALQVRRRAP